MSPEFLLLTANGLRLMASNEPDSRKDLRISTLHQPKIQPPNPAHALEIADNSRNSALFSQPLFFPRRAHSSLKSHASSLRVCGSHG